MPPQCHERTLKIERQGPRGRCGTLVGWCRKRGFWEGIMKSLRRRQFLRLTARTDALPAVSSIAWARAYPSRPVRVIEPHPAGVAYGSE
jgi:hypothetical protein